MLVSSSQCSFIIITPFQSQIFRRFLCLKCQAFIMLHLLYALTLPDHWTLTFLYLWEGADVFSVEVVQLLVNPALLHMSERLTTAGCVRQEELLGFLQLEITHSLLDLNQGAPWFQ